MEVETTRSVEGMEEAVTTCFREVDEVDSEAEAVESRVAEDNCIPDVE